MEMMINETENVASSVACKETWQWVSKFLLWSSLNGRDWGLPFIPPFVPWDFRKEFQTDQDAGRPVFFLGLVS